MQQKFPLFPLRIPHKGKNKGKYISFHYLMGWKALLGSKTLGIGTFYMIVVLLIIFIGLGTLFLKLKRTKKDLY